MNRIEDPSPPTLTADQGTEPAVGNRSQRRETAILAAVVGLVGERGYERVTVDAIAARARASKATIYRRWATKADLVVDALRRHADGNGDVALPDTGSVRGDLSAALDGIEQVITGSSGVSLLKLVEAIRDDEGLRDLIRAQVEGGSESAASSIAARALRRGEVLASASRDRARVMEVAFSQLLLRALLNGDSMPRPDREVLLDTILIPLFRGPPPAG